MDGGRILRAWLAERMDYVRATRRAVTIGQGFAMLLIFLGVWNPWLMLIGFFLFVGAQLEDRSVVFQSVLESVRMEDVMLTGFSTLSPADTLEDALHKAVHTLQDDFPVVRGSDMVGVINKQRIVEALRVGGNGYVQSAMVRAFDIAQRSDSLASAFRKLADPRTQHDSGGRSAAAGRHRHHAKPDAQHGPAGRDAQVAQTAGERVRAKMRRFSCAAVRLLLCHHEPASQAVKKVGAMRF